MELAWHGLADELTRLSPRGLAETWLGLGLGFVTLNPNPNPNPN